MPCSKIVPIQRRSTFSSIYENLQNCFKSLNNQGLIVSVETGSFVPLWFYDRSHEGSHIHFVDLWLSVCRVAYWLKRISKSSE